LTINDPNWTGPPNGPVSTELTVANGNLPPGGLLPGASVEIDITLNLSLNTPANLVIMNWAEISASHDINGRIIPDIDSYPDSINDDNFLVDDDISGNG
jgi:hypothetical protein